MTPNDGDRHGLSWEIGPDALRIDPEFLAVDFRDGHAARVYEYQG